MYEIHHVLLEGINHCDKLKTVMMGSILTLCVEHAYFEICHTFFPFTYG